jgi:agmatinase
VLTFAGVPRAAPPFAGADVVIVGVAPVGDAVRRADHLPADASRPHLALGVDALRDLVVVDAGDGAVTDVVRAAPLAVVLGAPHPAPTDVVRLRFSAHGDEGGGVQVGLRGYGPAPAAARVYEMAELAVRHLHPCLDEAFSLVCAGAEAVVLSVDVDAVDPSMAPGTRTPEPGGLTPRQLLDAVRRAALELPLVGVDVVGLAPELDGPGRPTAHLANRVVLEALSGVCRRRLELEQTR